MVTLGVFCYVCTHACVEVNEQPQLAGDRHQESSCFHFSSIGITTENHYTWIFKNMASWN